MKKNYLGKIFIAAIFVLYISILLLLYYKDNVIANASELSPVKQGDYWGYINKEEKLKIDYKFKDAGSFTNGHAIVTGQDKKGVINTKGEYIIKPEYIEITEFGDEYVLCEDSEGLYQIISTSDSSESYGPYSSAIVEDGKFIIVVDSKTGLSGLFEDGKFKFNCDYNSITYKNGIFELQIGETKTTYTVD